MADPARPYLFGCGMIWGQWLGFGEGETAKEWDRRSFDKIAQMGGTNAPANFAWIGIEPTRGTYNWDYVDHQVAEANARGLEIFAYTGLTPDWALPPGWLATYGPGSGYRTPPDEQYIPDFEAFFTALAARYRGQVKYYEFWNEPNGCSWINDGCSNGHMAHTYVPWLIRWYDAMKAGDPDCVLAVGGLDYNEFVTHGYEYIEDIYDNGGGDHFDAVAIHPYGYTTELHWQAITDTYQVLVNHGDGHKKLWLNEYGWNTPDENYKANAITTVLNELKKPEYHMVFQANYLVISDLPGTPDGGHDYGLCSRNTSTLELFPRQSWYAFQAVNKVFPTLVAFSADVTLGSPPLTVQFTDASAVAGASSWFWEFGDGGTSPLQHPQHTYTQAGPYDVKLTVTGPAGPEFLEKSGYIRVGNFPRVAFIGGQIPPTVPDSQVVQHIESLGYFVDVFDDEPANRPSASQIAAAYDIVVGSSTILSANVAGEFRNEAVPFIFWESSLAQSDRESLAAGPSTIPGQTQIDVIDNGHPVMDGIGAGLITVTTGGADFSRCTGAVAPGVRVLATAAGFNAQPTVMVAESGDLLLDGGTAAGKRAFLFLYDTTWGVTNATGKKILENALAWSLASPPGDFDGDRDVDMSDFGVFQACLSGPGVEQSDPACLAARMDEDLDVDGDDFGIFQACLSGPNVIAYSGCAGG